MCLIVMAWQVDADYPLVVAANRDEFFERPTEAAHWWADAPDVLAGRDLNRGGTWLGVTRTGRTAMVTNYREPPAGPRAPESRGALVADFLRGGESARRYLESIAARRGNFDAFNLVVSDGAALWSLGHREPAPRPLAGGIHGISNGAMDADWPKVTRAKSALAKALAAKGGGAGPERLAAALLDLLADRAPAPESRLPDTGVGLEWERRLSPVFVHSDGYGTRSSTVLLRHRGGRVHFHERSFDPDGAPAADVVEEFTVEADA